MSKIEKDKRLFSVEYMERKNREYFNRKSNNRRRSPTSSKRTYTGLALRFWGPRARLKNEAPP
jgi:hypothetical protein